jgi:hypothetical protein
MTEDIVMPNVNTHMKGIGKSTRQEERLKKFINKIKITSKERPIWLRKNI